MSFLGIGNIVLQTLTGLPSKETFLKHHVVPAKESDKFNTKRCGSCWDEYTDEHPGVKISPCGHVLGRDCLQHIVNGPAGNRCPYCRVNIFREPLTIALLLHPLLTRLLPAIEAYWEVFAQLHEKLLPCISLTTAYPLLRLLVILLFNGATPWAISFLLHHTDIRARNPEVQIDRLYDGTTTLTQLLLMTIPFFAPLLLPNYYVFGWGAFKASLVAANFAATAAYEGTALGYWQPPDHLAGEFQHFEDEHDRALAAYVALAAVAVQQLVVVTLLWPVSSLCCAWTVLATVAWR